MSTQYVVQTWAARKYLDLFRLALTQGDYAHMWVAVAYATVGGVRLIDRELRQVLGPRWQQMEKRWLVGIDWCRSDPPAMTRLANLERSKLRVPNGMAVIASRGCVPARSFHPKLFMLHGGQGCAIICGSGNLSANGLSKGCECGSLFLIKAEHRNESSDRSQVTELLRWFRSEWRNAVPYDQLESSYPDRCRDLIRQEKAVPTDDDIVPEASSQREQRTSLSEVQIRQLRTYDNFWIEAGALGANLGRGVPGNQLDMTRYTRVFFNAPPTPVPTNTIIDYITLVWDDEVHRGRTLRFANNGMDKLNVPSVGLRGPLFYRNKTLLFTRQPDGSFLFAAGTDVEQNRWRQMSRRVQAAYALPGGREWGLF